MDIVSIIKELLLVKEYTMKSRLVSITLIALIAMTTRGQAVKPVSGLRMGGANSNLMSKVGGIIRSPAQGPSIKVINAQNRMSLETVAEILNGMKMLMRMPMTVAQKPVHEDAAVLANTALKEKDVVAAIVLYEKADQPLLLVAPEVRWALLNVQALETSGVSSETLKMRMRKELWRAFGYVMGAANSTYDTCVMKPVFKPEDLDQIKGCTLGSDVLMKISTQASALGVKPSRVTTYRKACEEGWAPAPTNQFQKAIWDEVKGKH